LALSAYHVQDAAGYIKLDAMENPYSWPTAMTDEWLEYLRQARPNRYPDPAPAGLIRALREYAGIPEGADVMLGNGSDELIQIVLMGLAGKDATVLAPTPTFVMYRQLALSLGLRFVGVPLREDDFSLDMNAMRAAIREYRPAAIFLAYPNNPTGNAFAREDMLEIIRLAPGLAVVDEAYAPYADGTFMGDLGDFEHLLAMRTLSKLGLAGLRLGFMAGHPAAIGELDKLRLPYNINVLTRLSAEFALSRRNALDEQVACIRRDRERLIEALKSMPEIRVYPSQANFVTFKLDGDEALRVFAALKAEKILVKNLHAPAGPLRGCLRVTVGTTHENQVFMEKLTQILGG
jgi:histidinol-phosphate aminotransferase